MVIHPGAQIPDIPIDVLTEVRSAFRSASRAVSYRLCRLPNTWETTLDQSFIDRLADYGGPVLVGSGWTVRIETHFFGGGRHFGEWEIADIGILVMIRNGPLLARTKLALLQSKRLYPIEQAMDEAEREHYFVGFRRLMESEALAAAASTPRSFTFETGSSYKMILAGDAQVARIGEFERLNRTPVHYMLYNPAVIPWRQNHPLTHSAPRPDNDPVGCRVLPGRLIRKLLLARSPGESLSYSDMLDLPSPFRGRATTGGRRVEDFIERLVTCKEGYLASTPEDNALRTVFTRRTGPIAAAIGLTISAPGSPVTSGSTDLE